MNMLKRLISIALLTGAWQVSSAAELVREFSGSSTTITPSFTVEGPWLLDWRLYGDYDSLLALDITLVDSVSGRHMGKVLHTKQRGDGLKLFTTPGTYHLRVSTTLGRWQVKILRIEDDEVERYTPRGSKPAPGIIR
jgi:hypothetical protein